MYTDQSVYSTLLGAGNEQESRKQVSDITNPDSCKTILICHCQTQRAPQQKPSMFSALTSGATNSETVYSSKMKNFSVVITACVDVLAVCVQVPDVPELCEGATHQEPKEETTSRQDARGTEAGSIVLKTAGTIFIS